MRLCKTEALPGHRRRPKAFARRRKNRVAADVQNQRQRCFPTEFAGRKYSNFQTCFGSAGSDSLMRQATRWPSGLSLNAKTYASRTEGSFRGDPPRIGACHNSPGPSGTRCNLAMKDWLSGSHDAGAARAFAHTFQIIRRRLRLNFAHQPGGVCRAQHENSAQTFNSPRFALLAATKAFNSPHICTPISRKDKSLESVQA